MLIKKISLLLSLILFSSFSFAKDKAEDILGFWLSETKTAVIEIYKKEDEFQGKLVWLKDVHTGKKKVMLDKENPDKKLRSRNLLGLINLKGFSFKSGEWSGGEIYDPKSGKTYSAYMKLEDAQTLKLRGYVGISLFGRTSEWSRQKSATPDKYAK